MQLEKPWINSNGSHKKKRSVNQQKAIDEHQKWLEKRGLSSKQIRAKKTNFKEIVSEYSRRPKFETSNQVGNGFVKSIFEDTRNEKSSVRKEIQNKANRTASLYNKGGLQYVTDGEDITMIGSRSRRG